VLTGVTVGAILGITTLQQVTVVGWLGLLTPELGNLVNLGIADEHALKPDRPRQVSRLIEHVAAPDQVLCAGCIEHRARIDVGSHREGDA